MHMEASTCSGASRSWIAASAGELRIVLCGGVPHPKIWWWEIFTSQVPIFSQKKGWELGEFRVLKRQALTRWDLKIRRNLWQHSVVLLVFTGNFVACWLVIVATNSHFDSSDWYVFFNAGQSNVFFSRKASVRPEQPEISQNGKCSNLSQSVNNGWTFSLERKWGDVGLPLRPMKTGWFQSS